MMGWSPRCYIPSFVKIDPPVMEKKIFEGFLMTNIPIIWKLFGLMLNVPVNNFSVMLGRSHRFLGITSTLGGGGGKYVLLKDTTLRPEWDSNPKHLDPESEVLTTRPPRPHIIWK